MVTTQKVFLIEDDCDYLEIYEQVLNPEFNTIPFDNALDALEQFKQHQPKTIILDLNLPQMNGLQFCNTLFGKHCESSDVDIIFVSGENDPAIKLTAFEAGAADFITKPFELKELLFKVQASIQRKLKEESLLNEATENQNLIYTTMEQATQYSQVMSFFKNLSPCKNIEQLAQVFFNSMSFFGLHTSIRFKLPSLMHFRHDGLEITPIEQDVYNLLEAKGRLYEFSKRIIINDKYVSFIIKNPPRDEHALGQLRDYTAAMIEGLSAKILDIYSQTGMESAITELSSNIDKLKAGVQQHNQVTNSVMTNMMLEISGSYHSLEMTEQQEVFLNKLIDNSTQTLCHAEQHLSEIMSGLEGIKNNMETVQQAVNEQAQELSHSTNHSDDDIELF